MIYIVLCSDISRSMTIEKVLLKKGATVYSFKDMADFNNGFVPPFGDKPVEININFCIVASSKMPTISGYEGLGLTDLSTIQKILEEKNISFILCLSENLYELDQLQIN